MTARTDEDSIDAASTIKVPSSPDETFVPTPSEDESEEDLNAADTVFPKSLDLFTVESIRSSLERSKSLERRRSRRSNKSVDSEKRRSSTLANPLEVHISQDEAPLSIPGSPSSSRNGIFKSLEYATDPLPNSSSLPSFEFESPEVNLDLNLPLVETSGPEARTPKSNLKSVAKDYSAPSPQPQNNPQTYYHPLAKPPSTSQHLHQQAYNSNNEPASKILTKSGGGAVSFSSRIIVYDTYDSMIYDRRPEISTCNRLNPLLAQQIREEINHFKMEMQVHAESRIYTHFF